ncbi:MAG: hypothetical protein IPP55_20100 [Anaerolineales bacterium]|nr:hypothetical protein [Anaerolineales bacterium]
MGEIAWWDISKATSGKAVGEPAHDNLYDRYFFNPDKKIFALAKCSKYIPVPDYDTNKCNQYQIVIYNTETRAPMGKPIVINNFFLTSIAFNPIHNVIAAENCRMFSNDSLSCIDGEIILWNYENGDKIELAGGGEELAFNSDGTSLAAKNANTLKYWDLSAEKVVIHFPVDFSSNSKLFDQHDNRMIFDIDDQQNNNLIIDYYQNQPEEITLTSNVDLFALNPNGNTLVSMGKGITLWKLSDLSQTLTIPIPSPLFSHVQELALSPDNKTIAALACESYDITEFFSCINMKILIWGLESNSLIGQMALSNEHVMVPLSFSSDGEILVHGRTIWEFTPKAWINQTCARAGRNFTREEWRNYFPTKIIAKPANNGLWNQRNRNTYNTTLVTDITMTNPNDDPKIPSINADHNSNAVGSISAGGDISGSIHIGNVYQTAEDDLPLSSDEIENGLTRFAQFLPERAPVLQDSFSSIAKKLRATAMIST